MNKPFFSVIIPAYNRATIIRETIHSVLKQSFSDWELIIVNDGSKDNTKEVVKSIKDNRIKYIYQNNAERSAARNNGIRNSVGMYICFLDSDDLYEPNHLQILYDKIEYDGFITAMYFTNCIHLINNVKTITEFPKLEDASTYLLLNPVIPARVCIHKSILDKYKFREDIVIVEDQVLWVTISYFFPIIHIEQNTVVYRLHEDNSVNPEKNCFLPRLKGMQLLFNQKDVKNLIPTKIKQNIISDCYYGIAKFHWYKRDFFRMMAASILSIFYDFRNVQTKSKIYMIYAYIKRKKSLME